MVGKDRQFCYSPRMMTATQPPAIAILDSGLGGISIARALRRLAPDLPLTYLADTAAFPYGMLPPEAVTARGIALVEALQQQKPLRIVVLACNTLSTLALDALRQRFSEMHFVGTVPAIKVAAQHSKTRRFTLLATPNTAHSDYSKRLIAQFAPDAMVDCYGAPQLARYCEAAMLGEEVPDAEWAAQITPAFFSEGECRTDHVILGCTHYALCLEQLEKHACWPVAWVDSSDAVARQVLRLVGDTAHAGSMRGFVTRAADMLRYAPVYARELGSAGAAVLSIAALPGASRYALAKP